MTAAWMRRTGAIAIAGAALAALSACGGGGGGDEAASPQGYWYDDTTIGVVTSDNEFWSLRTGGTGGTELVLRHGTLATSGHSFSGVLDDFLISAAGKTSVSTSGTFVPRSSLGGSSTSASGATSAYTLRYDSTYEQAATLAKAAGSWQAMLVSGNLTHQHTGTVASDGKLTMTSRSWITGSSPSGTGCTLTGTLTPDPAGGNFFRIAGQFGTSGCKAPNASVRGLVTVSTRNGTSVMTGGVLWNGEGMPLALLRS